jgi:hypothetical protein
MEIAHPIKSLTQEYVLTLALIWLIIWSAFYFAGFIGIYIYIVYAISGILMILVDWYGTQRYLIGLGVIWIAAFFLLYLAGIINEFSDIIYMIPGAVMILIALYNWGSGIDISKKQENPIENLDIEWNYGSG